eukprot:m.43360 g.43360  ORF g.43360 m.43360 type:complete len:69 (-) comp17125_c0_seq1:662-868(-)
MTPMRQFTTFMPLKNNDPNGIIFDPHTSLYHRFYQYGPTINDSCTHTHSCPGSRIAWGHSVSYNLIHW